MAAGDTLKAGTQAAGRGATRTAADALRFWVLWHIDRSGLCDDVFEKPIQQFGAILHRQFGIGCKLLNDHVSVLLIFHLIYHFTLTLLSASKMGLKYTRTSPLETYIILLLVKASRTEFDFTSQIRLPVQAQ